MARRKKRTPKEPAGQAGMPTPTQILTAMNQLDPGELKALLAQAPHVAAERAKAPQQQPKTGGRKQNRGSKKKVDSAPERAMIIPGEEEVKPKKRPTTRKSRRNQNVHILKPGENKGRNQGYTESMPRERDDIDDVNDFDVQDYARTATDDTKWQKKVDPVYNGADPAERRDDFQGVEAQCHKCKGTFQTTGDQLHYDAMGKEWRYVCNQCAITGGS